MTQFDVVAKKWSGGWELFFNEDDVTQSRTLDGAKQQVLDYLATCYPDIAYSDLDIKIHVEDYEDAVYRAKQKTLEAEKLTQEAAEETKALVRMLRFKKGLSLADTAAILGVSKTRVQQLQGKKPQAA